MKHELYIGDARDILQQFSSSCIHLVIAYRVGPDKSPRCEECLLSRKSKSGNLTSVNKC